MAQAHKLEVCVRNLGTVSHSNQITTPEFESILSPNSLIRREGFIVAFLKYLFDNNGTDKAKALCVLSTYSIRTELIKLRCSLHLNLG